MYSKRVEVLYQTLAEMHWYWINLRRKQAPFSRAYISEFPRNQLQACFCRDQKITDMCWVASDVPEATGGDGVLLISESIAFREEREG